MWRREEKCDDRLGKARRGGEDGGEWMRRGRKSSLEREQWFVTQERRESEVSKNTDKKIVMVKLMIQKKNPCTITTKNQSA
jgi:hypothetical protein